MSGWIKIHRKLKSWEWYDDHSTTRLFVHILLSVNSKNGSHQGVVIPIGCVKTGRKELARQTGLSEQQVRRSLNNLQKSNDITIKPTNKYSLISVAKWGEYQSISEKATSKRTNQQPANAPTNNHKQEEKKKEIKKILDSLSPSRRSLVEKWLAYKKTKKQSYQPQSIPTLIKGWSVYSDDALGEAIEKSIINNWSGCFISDADNNSKSNSRYDAPNSGSCMI